MTTKIFAIRNKETGEFVSYNSKCAWTKAGNAKNAFNLHGSWYEHSDSTSWRVRFDEQDRYEIVDLTEAYYRLEGLMK